MAWTTATTRATGFNVTAAVWNSEHVDNMNYLREVAYVQFTADVSITATTAATANQIVSAGAISYENVPHLIEFDCQAIATPAVASANLVFQLYDGSDVTSLRTVTNNTTAALTRHPGYMAYRLTPTAASHTYSIRAFVSSGTGTILANAGGAGTNRPGYIRITRIPT